jgi:hypothetical protein
MMQLASRSTDTSSLRWGQGDFLVCANRACVFPQRQFLYNTTNNAQGRFTAHFNYPSYTYGGTSEINSDLSNRPYPPQPNLLLDQGSFVRVAMTLPPRITAVAMKGFSTVSRCHEPSH